MERDRNRFGTGAAAGREALRALHAALAPRTPGPGALLPLGVEPVDASLSGGLSLDHLHEIAPAEAADDAAALGFATALLAKRAGAAPGRDILLVLPEDGPLVDGHGLAALGLPPERLLVLRVRGAAAALAALEEALRGGGLAAILGLVEAGLDLRASRRLQLAAEGRDLLLLALRPAGAGTPNAAATRWRIGAAEGLRDRFGCLERPRWRVELARCRNGRPGRWLLEWDHAAHRLRLAGGLRDHARPEDSSTRASA